MNVPATYSVYRGLADSGVGENGKNDIAYGEQYLAIDSEINHPWVYGLLRPWMTLDTTPEDRGFLQNRIQSWSTFEHRGGYFLISLVSTDKYDDRPAYFAHARMWAWRDCINGFDPGIYFGCADCFDSPWRQIKDKGNAGLPRLETQWSRIAQSSHDSALVSLLAYYLYCLDNNACLVIVAELNDFLPDSELANRVALLRLCLPAGKKKQAVIRYYAQAPELFLHQSKMDTHHVPQANLLILPQSAMARLAETTNRPLIMLSKTGEPLSGRKNTVSPDSDHASYAKKLINQVKKNPQLLIRFTEHYAKQSLNTRERNVLISSTYSMVNALTNEKKKADYLTQQLPIILDNPKTTGIATKSFLSDETLDQFGFDCIDRTGIYYHENKQYPQGQRRLKKRLQEYALTKRRQWTPSNDFYGRTLNGAEQDQFLQLLGRKLQGEPMAEPLNENEAQIKQILSEQINTDRLLDHPNAETILRKEITWNLLHLREKRLTNNPRLLTHKALMPTLAQAVNQGKLNTGWCQAIITNSATEPLIELFDVVFAPTSIISRWLQTLHTLLPRLLDQAEKNLIARIKLPSQSKIKDLLDTTLTHDTAKSIIFNLAKLDYQINQEHINDKNHVLGILLHQEITPIAEQLAKYALDNDYFALTPIVYTRQNGNRSVLQIPDACLHGLLSNKVYCEKENTNTLLARVKQLPEEQATPGTVIQVVNQRLSEDNVLTISQLIQTHLWLHWYTLANWSDKDKKRYAKQWLEIYKYGKKIQIPTLSEWRIICQTLPDDVFGDIEQYFPLSNPSSPLWIPTLVEEQYKTIASRINDLSQLLILYQQYPYLDHKHLSQLLIANSKWSHVYPKNVLNYICKENIEIDQNNLLDRQQNERLINELDADWHQYPAAKKYIQKSLEKENEEYLFSTIRQIKKDDLLNGDLVLKLVHAIPFLYNNQFGFDDDWFESNQNQLESLNNISFLSSHHTNIENETLLDGLIRHGYDNLARSLNANVTTKIKERNKYTSIYKGLIATNQREQTAADIMHMIHEWAEKPEHVIQDNPWMKLWRYANTIESTKEAESVIKSIINLFTNQQHQREQIAVDGEQNAILPMFEFCIGFNIRFDVDEDNIKIISLILYNWGYSRFDHEDIDTKNLSAALENSIKRMSRGDTGFLINTDPYRIFSYLNARFPHFKLGQMNV